MRLKEKEVAIIKNIITEIFGDVKIYLFGSRLNMHKKGGDIDLYIITKDTTNLFEKKIRALAKLKMNLFKPIDIVIHKDFNRPIEQEALKGKIL
jgi:predicted nucleotidyltransferase